MKTFCITLPEWPDRTARAAAHFKERGLDNVEMVQGIHADNAGLQTRFPYEKDNPGSGFNVGPKHVGIWLGHYLMWSICATHPQSHFLLLEDDVDLHPNFVARFNQAMQDVPTEFDMLFVGSCCTVGRQVTHVRGDVYDVRYPLCNHAYVIAKKFIPTLLGGMRKMYGPVDCMMFFDLFTPNPDYKIYTVLPRMADQNGTELHP